jgi:hypothetical protein
MCCTKEAIAQKACNNLGPFLGFRYTLDPKAATPTWIDKFTTWGSCVCAQTLGMFD